MKKMLIIVALFFANSVYAQPSASRGKWDENERSRSGITASSPNKFADVDVSVGNRVITLNNLPELSHPVWAIITSAGGEQLEQKRVSPGENTLDMHRLRKGEMYFLTLMYKDKSKKAFVIRR